MKLKFFATIIIASAAALSSFAQDSADSAVAVETTLPDSTSEAIPASAPASAVSLTDAADSAYAADNFQLAQQLYEKALADFGSSSVLFYNLGNAYYRQGNLGKALLNYERALRIDPTNTDARTNLDFVREKITDRQLNEKSITARLWDSIVCAFHADTWAWISILLFALFLAGVVTYLFSSVIIVRKVSFFGGAVIFILCTLSVIVSFAAANRIDDHNEAIILPPAAQLSTSPREARTQSEEAFLLHEGTKVEIVDSVSTSSEGKWYEVIVNSNERAWIKASEVERI